VILLKHKDNAFTSSALRTGWESAMNFLAVLERQNKPSYLYVLAGIALIVLIGLLDYLTGYELAFSVFYIFPIALVTWVTDRRLGLLTSVAGAVVWLGADMAAGHLYSINLIYIWNTLIRFSVFVIVTMLFSALKKATDRERELARLDNLTGAVNSRFFYDLAQMEIARFQRYKRPFTLAYIDLDNFKTVNDRFGHPEGDRVLRIVVRSIKNYIRKTDVIARLGGDEFVLLLPETNEESAGIALSKIQIDLLDEMQSGNWPVTFSIGVLTCMAVPDTLDELVRMADELMYSVKHDTKNAIKFLTYKG